MTREEKLAAVGDYVLGLMETSERVTFEAQLATDRELAGMVDRLASQMHALDETAPPAAYSPTLWGDIESRLSEAPRADREASVVVPLRPRAPPSRLIAWAAMAASVVVALGVGYFAGSSLGTTTPEPVVIAVLLNESSALPAVIVEAFDDDSVRLVPLETFVVPEGQVMQVWTLPDPETGPVSLGTLPDGVDVRLSGPNLPLPLDGQLYEITLEPAPGSPTGRPTGPILVKGFARLPQN